MGTYAFVVRIEFDSLTNYPVGRQSCGSSRSLARRAPRYLAHEGPRPR
jgi:hypothetical protein